MKVQGDKVLSFRPATPDDSDDIARLHADSWRRHYRFAYPEEFFGPSLDADRAATWRDRLATDGGAHTILAELDGEPVGFVHVVPDDHPRWGSLVDNLHVRHDCQGGGLGIGLLRRGASAICDSGGSMYLWVLEQNRRARGFYEAAGAREVETQPALPPALPGINRIRCAWDEVDGLSAS